MPIELVRMILERADLPIDTRLAFKIRPKRLDEMRGWRLWYLLKSHDGLLYNLGSKSLHIMRVPGFHIIRRPVELGLHSEWYTSFVASDHMVEVTGPDGIFGAFTEDESAFFTRLRVLLVS